MKFINKTIIISACFTVFVRNWINKDLGAFGPRFKQVQRLNQLLVSRLNRLNRLINCHWVQLKMTFWQWTSRRVAKPSIISMSYLIMKVSQQHSDFKLSLFFNISRWKYALCFTTKTFFLWKLTKCSNKLGAYIKYWYVTSDKL